MRLGKNTKIELIKNIPLFARLSKKELAEVASLADEIDFPGGKEIIREGELCLLPALVPHSPHRPADTWGLVVEVKRRPEQTESLLWFCERCDRLLHEVTMHVADIEGELKAAIEHFDASLALRTCAGCGHVHANRAPLVDPVA